MTRGKKTYFIWLSLIVLLGFLLRFVGFNQYPPGFTADEAVFGYNAYSLLKTGQDEFGRSLPVALKAFGDYRPALYSYLAVPFVWLLGLSQLATRLPSMLAGSLTILVAALLAKVITKNQLISLLVALLLATSPSHILISRFADMAPLSSLFLALGVWLLMVWSQRPKLLWLLVACLSFVLSAYSYHSARVTGPLLLVCLFWLNFKTIKANLKQVLISAAFGLVLLSPLLAFTLKFPELAVRRGLSESFLRQKAYQISAWQLISSDAPGQHPLITRFFHNQAKALLTQYFGNYLEHLSADFLFWQGDPNERFQTPLSGVYNLAILILAPVGFWLALHSRRTLILPLWLLISPLISSIGLFTPNSLHTLDSVVPMTILAGIGAHHLSSRLKPQKAKLAIGFLSITFIYSLLRFLYGYFVIIPQSGELRWNWYPQMQALVASLNQLDQSEPLTVVNSRNIHQFILFYNQIEPSWYQQNVVVSELVDENGFNQISQFGRFHFIANLSDKHQISTRLLVIDRQSIPDWLIWQELNPPLDADNLLTKPEKIIYDQATGQPIYLILNIPLKNI